MSHSTNSTRIEMSRRMMTQRVALSLTGVLLGAVVVLASAQAEAGCGIFARQEIEGSDGLVVKLLRILGVPSVRTATTNRARYETFWAAGPSPTELQAWHDLECATCPAPAGFDELDGTIDRLQEFVDLSKSLKDQPIDDVVSAWQSWLLLLIDDDSPNDFDDMLKVIAQGGPSKNPLGLPGWRTELIDVRDKQVPLCAITSPESDKVTIDNSPCTINNTRKAEFNREFANIRSFLTTITNPQSQFYKDLITTRILPQLTVQRLEYFTDVRNLTVTLNPNSLALVNGMLLYTFTYTFDYLKQYSNCTCGPPTWVSTSKQGEGYVAITKLELGGSPAKNGLIIYTFAYNFGYEYPHPYDPPGCTSCEVRWPPAAFGTVDSTRPASFACRYSLGSCSGSTGCSGVDFCFNEGQCTYPTAQSGAEYPITFRSSPSAGVYCTAAGTPWESCTGPNGYLTTSPPCTQLGPIGTPGPDWPREPSGTHRIDDDNPTGTGLTISPPRTVNAPVTVQSFRDGVDALDGFVNGIEPNATCPPGEICFGSSDADTDDEFWPVLDELATFTQNVETFRTAAKSFSDHMWQTFGQSGGINPVTYTWQDSAGIHSVSARVSHFKIAQIRPRKKGNWLKGKVCQRLEDFEDTTGANTWVQISRKDPSKELGLWKWNPFGGKITKKGCAAYSFDRVGLVRCP